eukprot:scaffold218346_cov30-Tisochrysis_lutea.AAC.1
MSSSGSVVFVAAAQRMRPRAKELTALLAGKAGALTSTERFKRVCRDDKFCRSCTGNLRAAIAIIHYSKEARKTLDHLASCASSSAS